MKDVDRSLPLGFALALATAWALTVPQAASADAQSSGAAADSAPPAPGRAPFSVALADRPPGSVPDDGGPSTAIFPPQYLPLRFSHRRHVQGLGLACDACHDRAPKSQSSADDLFPDPARCDTCHDVEHDNLERFVAERPDAKNQCSFCHQGHEPEHGTRVARLVKPRPNLRFSHRAHSARNIGCRQCHGEVQHLDLATRDQMPRMRGCLRCHDEPPPARGDADGECDTCHLTRGNVLKTEFESGTLWPPRWLHRADHGPDWIRRHREVAATDSQLCASCHTDNECIACHDGRVRPRRVHPNDWLNLHAVSALQNTPRCTSCHRQQSFCLPCHQRAGVAWSGPTANFAQRGRFHPPRAVWTGTPRGTGHHAWEAQRNLDACVSCHTERDCVVCHATAGLGGAGASAPATGRGVNPHPPGFAAQCRRALQNNPRPCLVCHGASDPRLERCR